jgi:tetratricopeptide (TPR) repeat protein
MKKSFFFAMYLFGIFLFIPKIINAQQEESAEVSLEEVEDAFQENFYEALKQMAIENYDLAIDLLLECKNLDPDNIVVDFELGKNYTLQKNYMEAETYLLNAVKKDPDNIWYLEALFDLYDSQKNNAKSIEIAKELAKKNSKYKMYLVNLYFNTSKYKKALALLDELDEEFGTTNLRKNIKAKIMVVSYMEDKKNDYEVENTSEKNNPLITIDAQIESLINTSNFNELLIISEEALENYPAQAKFYYSKGLALNKLKKHNEAIEILLISIDYLIDDLELENNIYRELMLAYEAVGNDEKSKEFQRKLKKGS